MAQKNLSTENKQTITTKLIDMENRLVVAKGEGGSGCSEAYGVPGSGIRFELQLQ